jgi:hypothetical protein
MNALNKPLVVLNIILGRDVVVVIGIICPEVYDHKICLGLGSEIPRLWFLYSTFVRAKPK